MKRGALIGCGFFARNHLHAWGLIDGVEIVAVCDVDEAKARDYAEGFGVRGGLHGRGGAARGRTSSTL